jgi:hypothetical protein
MQAVREFIRFDVLISGHISHDNDFRFCAISTRFEKFEGKESLRNFDCSNGDIDNLKTNHWFTSRAFHCKRRLSVTITQEYH